MNADLLTDNLRLVPGSRDGVLAWVEGIIYLMKTDEEFYQTYVVEKKAWF